MVFPDGYMSGVRRREARRAATPWGASAARAGALAGAAWLATAPVFGAPVPWPAREAVCNAVRAGCDAAGDPQAARAQLLVVLSPRMVYALREWPRLRNQAQAAGFDVHGVRDPQVPEAEWQSAVTAAGLFELAAWPPARLDDWPGIQVRNHWPMAWVRWQGRTHPWPILGVMPDVSWLQLLRERLEDLQACTGQP